MTAVEKRLREERFKGRFADMLFTCKKYNTFYYIFFL